MLPPLMPERRLLPSFPKRFTMSSPLAARIAQEMGVSPRQVEATAALLDEGATVPFIARYRKERTDGLDDQQVTTVRDRLASLRALEELRAQVLASIDKQGKLSEELRKAIQAAATRTEVEDLYLPYRPKRRTRAGMAREKGLEPLADLIWEQGDQVVGSRESLASPFLAACPDLSDAEAAWQGARDIVAERVSEDAAIRSSLRTLAWQTGMLVTRVLPGQEEAGARFRDYFDHREMARKVPSHRLLAMRRGEAEGILAMRFEVDRERSLQEVAWRMIQNPRAALLDDLKRALEDGYDRLLASSIETDVRMLLKEKADAEAIAVFADNLKQLLLAPPLGSQKILALDPGFRTGCKMVALSPEGELLEHTVLHPHTGGGGAEVASRTLAEWLTRHSPQAIAIGNGTAGRETDTFVRKVLVEKGISVVVVAVNEAGASVYSASEVAREELPDQDVTVRGAVSIGRRLQDPLAELVKIDPKSIGVGQYQHDVDAPSLRKSLEDVVVGCVNGVGVDLNTASPRLLEHVSGIGPSLARSLVAWRAEKGPFKSRRQLLEVPRLGAKTFELAAGFLRIRGGEHPLDASAVHPERYPLVQKMAEDLGVAMGSLVGKDEMVGRIPWQKYVSHEVGAPTLQDILAELRKPGRDPRRAFETASFRADVTEIAHLQEGMTLQGVVTNVTNFGAFVDIGVHQDGLVHISELSHRFIRAPGEVVAVGDRVLVRVMGVDGPRKRIALSLKATTDPPPPPPAPPPRARSEAQEQGRSPSPGRPPQTPPRRESPSGPPRSGQGENQSRPPPREAPRPQRPEPFNNALAGALSGLKLKK